MSPDGVVGALLGKISFLTSMGYPAAAHAECAAWASRSYRLPEWMLLDALDTLARRRGTAVDGGEATLLWESEQLLRGCIA